MHTHTPTCVQGKHLRLATYLTDSGWQKEESFLQYIDKQCTLKPGKRGLLIMDLYRVHRTPAVLAKLEGMGWTVAFIPGGLTSKVQVMDLVVNRPFKHKVRQLYRSWRREHTEQRVTRADVCAFAVNAWNSIAASDVMTCIQEHALITDDKYAS